MFAQSVGTYTVSPDVLRTPRVRAQDELRAHRGRELTGMVNSQFFFIYMLQQIERFRPLVEACRAECCSAVLSVGTALAAAVARRYPAVTDTLAAAVGSVVGEAAETLMPELDSVFEKERNPFTDNQVKGLKQ